MQFASFSAETVASSWRRSTSTLAFHHFLDPFTRPFIPTSHFSGLHRPLTTIIHLLRYFLHPSRAWQCGKLHTQAPPSASHRAFNPRSLLSATVQPPTPNCIPIMQWGRCGSHLHKALECRRLGALAFQDTVSQAEHLCRVQTSNEGSNQTQKLMHDVDTSGFKDVQMSMSRNRDLCSESDEKSLRDADVEAKQVAHSETKQVEVVQESVEALEDLLKELETSAADGDPKIGALYLRLAQLCISKDEDPEKILLYGERALKILGTPEISLAHATCLEVIGCAYHKKGEFEKAVTYLERAAFILNKLKASVKEEEMGSLQYAVQALLGQAKMSLGREEEALVNFLDALDINERVLDAHDPNLGKSYHQIAEAFMQVQDLHEALALCLKALPIYTKCYGSTSLQVAELRKLLSVIHYGLDNFENVLSEHQIVRPIFEALGKSEEVASLDLATGEALLCLDRYTKAISVLKDVVKQTAPVNHGHAQALVLLAKAYAYSKKEKSASTHCKKALEVLRKKEPSIEAGASSVELALVFRQLDETEKALSTFKMSLEIYRKYPNEQAAVAFIEGQIGLIHLGSGRTNEALPYLETYLANNEGVLGLKNKELLDVYNRLGSAYIQLKKLDEALAMFEAGRTVAEENNMLKHPEVITLYHNLASAYTTLGRLRDAISCQQLLVKIMKKTGLETEIRLEDAEKKLEALLQEVDKW